MASDASDDGPSTGIEAASDQPRALTEPEPAAPADELGPAATSPQVVDYFFANRLDVAAGDQLYLVWIPHFQYQHG